MLRNNHWLEAGWELDYHAIIRNLNFLKPKGLRIWRPIGFAVHTCGDTSLMIWVLSKRDSGRAIAQTLDLMHKRKVRAGVGAGVAFRRTSETAHGRDIITARSI